MKKTLIALMALAGMACAADWNVENVWTANFGSEYGSAGYEVTGLTSVGTFWDAGKCAVEGGALTTSSQRIHMSGGVYGSWTDDFQYSITLTLGETISASTAWPVFAEIKGNGTELRFGPYTEVNNTVNIDGSVDKLGAGTVSVLAGGTHTITLTKVGQYVNVAVDGVVSMSGTLQGTPTGNITDIAIGGNTGSNYRINSTVHSISYGIIPEPTTATLSLLALAGLAARRRRK